jgi:hypothetical protein
MNMDIQNIEKFTYCIQVIYILWSPFQLQFRIKIILIFLFSIKKNGKHHVHRVVFHVVRPFSGLVQNFDLLY